jgi:exonuclease SbcD
VIKIIHTADVHLDSPLKSLALRDPELKEQVQIATRSAFTHIIDTAISESVTALLISGDLFDGTQRSANTAAYLTGEFDRLRDVDIQVFYIKGNHDAENPLTGEITLPKNVHAFDGRGGKIPLSENIWIHGVSFANRHAPESLLPKFQEPVSGAFNIAMLHTSLAGAAGHDPYAPCSVNELASLGFDYWALGHVHGRKIHSESPWIVMPGMPQGRDIGEAGPKSASLLSIGETIEVSEISTSQVEFLNITFDVDEAESDDRLRDILRQGLRETESRLKARSGVVRVTLSGSTPRRWQILRDQDFWGMAASKFARETGKLWLDTLIFDLTDIPASSNSASDELALIMETIRGEPGFSETSRTELENILTELPLRRRGELMPDAETVGKLADRLADDGAEFILARMKGATN